MPTFDSPADLHTEAYDLYLCGKHSAAALTWARAKESARTLGDSAATFAAGFWEAHAWVRGGAHRRAWGLLLELLSDVPPDAPSYEYWLAQTSCFEIQLGLRPDLARLQRLLSDLEALAVRQTHPAADLHLIRGQLAFFQGSWVAALGHFARGWQAYDGNGYCKYGSAWWAFNCCLRLGRRPEANSWCQHLSVVNQDDRDEARQFLKAATLLRALEARDLAAVATCVDNGCGRERHYELRGQLLMRDNSLDPLHDPADHSHPARKLAATTREQDVHTRYDNLLALVDYRLACLRFTAGMPAVDDLYYRQPDALPERITLAEPATFQQQLQSFDFSWRMLQRLARRLDTLLQCDYRTQEAHSRRQRRDALAAACQV